MKKLFFCSLFLLTNFYRGWCQKNNGLSQLDSFLLKNYSLPETLKTDCNFNYVAMVLKSDSKGVITEINYLNEAHPDLRESFEILKKFKFGTSMKGNRRPILVIGTVDQRNNKLCPVLYPSEASPSKVMREIVNVVKGQLAKDPQTILLGVFTAVSPAPPIR